MPTYHFNVVDGGDHPDPDGTSLAGVAQARRAALAAAGDMLRDASMGGPFGRDWSMTVTDPSGLVLFKLDFQLSESSAVKHANFKS